MKATIALKKISLNPEAEIVDILRHALTIAENLEIEKIKKWCKSELNGYGDEPIPEYRNIEGSIHALNILTGSRNILNTDGATIPMGHEIIFFQEALLKNQHTYTYTLPTDIQNTLKGYLTHSYSNIHISILQEIDRFAFKRVVDVVRTKVLEFAIELEKQNIFGEEWEFTMQEKLMTQNFTYNINNVGNMANHNENSTINQASTNTVNVIKGDFNSLASNLRSYGVEDFDIQELQTILDAFPIPQSEKEYQTDLKEWMKKMFGKSLDGSWQIGAGAAGTILASGIQNYFGLIG